MTGLASSWTALLWAKSGTVLMFRKVVVRSWRNFAKYLWRSSHLWSSAEQILHFQNIVQNVQFIKKLVSPLRLWVFYQVYLSKVEWERLWAPWPWVCDLLAKGWAGVRRCTIPWTPSVSRSKEDGRYPLVWLQSESQNVWVPQIYNRFPFKIWKCLYTIDSKTVSYLENVLLNERVTWSGLGLWTRPLVRLKPRPWFSTSGPCTRPRRLFPGQTACGAGKAIGTRPGW